MSTLCTKLKQAVLELSRVLFIGYQFVLTEVGVGWIEASFSPY